MVLTIKQQKFAAEYLKDGNASRAYRAAYDAKKMGDGAIQVAACRLLKSTKVALSVSAARERVAAKAEITLETITDMLIADRKFAIEQESPSACVAATMGLAKVTGLAVDKVEHSGGLKVVALSPADTAVL